MLSRSERVYQDLFRRLLATTTDAEFNIKIIVREWVNIVPEYVPSFLLPHPSSIIPHPSSLLPPPSSLLPPPSSLLPPPSSLLPPPSSLLPPPSSLLPPPSSLLPPYIVSPFITISTNLSSLLSFFLSFLLLGTNLEDLCMKESSTR